MIFMLHKDVFPNYLFLVYYFQIFFAIINLSQFKLFSICFVKYNYKSQSGLSNYESNLAILPSFLPNDNTELRKNKHLNFKERITIQLRLKDGFSAYCVCQESCRIDFKNSCAITFLYLLKFCSIIESNIKMLSGQNVCNPLQIISLSF